MHIFKTKSSKSHTSTTWTHNIYQWAQFCFMSYICANQTLFEIVHIVLQTKTTVQFNVSIVILL